MDLISIVVGALIGVVIGFIIAWQWASIRANKKGANLSRSEKELKTILAEQAHHHISSSKESIEAIQLRLEQLTNNLQQYESSLQVGSEENDKVSFFGEHASVFLRNNKSVKASNDRINVGDAPPRDFANNGSGLFVGNVAENKTLNK
ncbi:ZapG family protein [Glaciecola siphonariae]|uniref:ZapG family protein n=1 Tax=Glaciecola siphonariae TaxID=521012 RepID=A0ABV9LZL3_9ALTE